MAAQANRKDLSASLRPYEKRRGAKKQVSVMNIRWKAASMAEHISLICTPVVIMFGESDVTSNIGKERVREK